MLERDEDVLRVPEVLLVRGINGSWPQKSDSLPVFVYLN